MIVKKKKGDVVNLENDPVGKYVERFLTMPVQEKDEKTEKQGITMEFLSKNGF